MDPAYFRLFLISNGCKHKRTRPEGVEVWIKDGLNVPIVFYGLDVPTPTELTRLVALKGETTLALGDWRKKNEPSDSSA